MLSDDLYRIFASSSQPCPGRKFYVHQVKGVLLETLYVTLSILILAGYPGKHELGGSFGDYS